MKNAIINICHNEFSNFQSIYNVIGIGLGSKVTMGINTNEPCIKVLVTKKQPLTKLNSKDIIPKIYKELKTDIIEIGEISQLSLKDRVRPLVFGCSIMPLRAPYTGTAGALVTDGIDYYILSNNHVLCICNKIPIGEPILQPSRMDGGIYPDDVVAYLYKFIPLITNSQGSKILNFADAAIAKIYKRVPFTSYIQSFGTPRGVIANPDIGTKVKKNGRTSGITTGQIVATNVTYSQPSSATVLSEVENILYRDAIITDSVSMPGDSGSLLLDEDNFAIGLLHSGSLNVSISSPIDMILSYFGVSLVCYP